MTISAALSCRLRRHRHQFGGDAVMTALGAPDPMPHHADRAPAAAVAKHVAQNAINAQWADQGVEAFGVGNGIATGPVAAALLWSQEPIEYTVVGDTVNLTQRLQQWASPGEMLIGAPTYPAVDGPPAVVELDPALVKGRETPVTVCGFPERVS